MVTVFSIGCKLYLAEDLTAICLHSSPFSFYFFMKIRNLEGHYNIVRNDIKLLLLPCYQAKMYSSKIYLSKK